ncbi:hypothetical protein QWZ16_12670 [Vibrio ostreicida]|uniref:Uncharacterized protein n=1 Tax=Vibrio ostreicida TaxID=526588 RepID=A0ABT8BUV5_9VIBR|nr:hypothetical protein [Vibrio ostreicida]MDN3610557.1 hypothetical protein [Vibrio ostreicida]
MSDIFQALPPKVSPISLRIKIQTQHSTDLLDSCRADPSLL